MTRIGIIGIAATTPIATMTAVAQSTTRLRSDISVSLSARSAIGPVAVSSVGAHRLGAVQHLAAGGRISRGTLTL